MAKHGKLLAWIRPILLPVIITGVRGLLEKRRAAKDTSKGDYSASNRDVLDTLVDVGLAGLTKGRGKGLGR